MVSMESTYKIFNQSKSFLAVIFLQFGLAGMDILSKVALNNGMSNYILVTYRLAVATLVTAPFAIIVDKKVRPKMTLSIFIKLLLLSLLEPVIDQNLYYLGMKYTSATFAATMINILPAITFVMACVLRLERLKLKNIRSQAKIIGTVAAVAGAMAMTLLKGPPIGLPWTNGRSGHSVKHLDITFHDAIKGSVMITIGCFCWAAFVILQAITLKTYPAELSMTAWICLLGTLESAAVALVMEKSNFAVWAIRWDTNLLAAVYSGVFCSALAYYIQGIVMKERGPVYVTAFNPLCMVIVAILSSFIMAERMYLGRVLGAVVIVVGLYLVIWGKSKDHNEPSSAVIDQKTTTEGCEVEATKKEDNVKSNFVEHLDQCV